MPCEGGHPGLAKAIGRDARGSWARHDHDVLQAVSHGDRPARWVAASAVPRSFVWVPWQDSLLEQHAEVKYLSFVGEVDAYVFPCLGDRSGCRRLMCNPAKARFFARCDLVGCLFSRLRWHGARGHGPGPNRCNPKCGRASPIPGVGSGLGSGSPGTGRILPGGPPEGLPGVTAENGAPRSNSIERRFRRAKTLQGSKRLEKGEGY